MFLLLYSLFIPAVCLSTDGVVVVEGGEGGGGGEVKRFSVGTLLVRLMHSILTLTQKAGLSQCGLTQWSRNEFVMVLITADYFMFSKYIT